MQSKPKLDVTYYLVFVLVLWAGICAKYIPLSAGMQEQAGMNLPGLSIIIYKIWSTLSADPLLLATLFIIFIGSFRVFDLHKIEPASVKDPKVRTRWIIGVVGLGFLLYVITLIAVYLPIINMVNSQQP